MGKAIGGQQQIWAKTLDFIVQDYATREVLFHVGYAQDVSISSEYEKLEIKGGSENEVQFTNYHSPTSQFAANLPLIDKNVLQAKTGAIRKIGVQLNAFDKVYTVGAGGKVEMDVVPKSGTLKVHNTNNDDDLLNEIKVGVGEPTEEQYTITEKTLTFHSSKIGKQVLVVCDYMTGENADGLKFVSGKLPQLIRITAKTKAERKSGEKPVYQTIIVDKAKPDPTFSFETSAGNASIMPFECEVFGWTNEDGDTQFFRIVEDADLE